MRQGVLLSLAGGAAFIGVALGVQEITRTFVVNLKDPHPIEGSVQVPQPIPHSEVASLLDVVVAPAPRSDPPLWTDAGSLETDGFITVVLSFHGQFRGNPGAPGSVGLVLVPDEENILRSFAEGEIHLALEAVAENIPDGRLYFSASQAGLSVAFPRYRVFLYNTTDRSASVNIFAYLVQ
jgi:hypothetical protein